MFISIMFRDNKSRIVIIGLLSYPRFHSTPKSIESRKAVLKESYQSSYPMKLELMDFKVDIESPIGKQYQKMMK